MAEDNRMLTLTSLENGEPVKCFYLLICSSYFPAREIEFSCGMRTFTLKQLSNKKGILNCRIRLPGTGGGVISSFHFSS